MKNGTLGNIRLNHIEIVYEHELPDYSIEARYKNHGYQVSKPWYNFIGTKYQVVEILTHKSLKTADRQYVKDDLDQISKMRVPKHTIFQYYAKAVVTLESWWINRFLPEDQNIISYVITNLPEYWYVSGDGISIMTKFILNDLSKKLQVIGISDNEIKNAVYHFNINDTKPRTQKRIEKYVNKCKNVMVDI